MNNKDEYDNDDDDDDNDDDNNDDDDDGDVLKLFLMKTRKSVVRRW